MTCRSSPMGPKASRPFTSHQGTGLLQNKPGVLISSLVYTWVAKKGASNFLRAWPQLLAVLALERPRAYPLWTKNTHMWASWEQSIFWGQATFTDLSPEPSQPLCEVDSLSSSWQLKKWGWEAVSQGETVLVVEEGLEPRSVSQRPSH